MNDFENEFPENGADVPQPTDAGSPETPGYPSDSPCEEIPQPVVPVMLSSGEEGADEILKPDGESVDFLPKMPSQSKTDEKNKNFFLIVLCYVLAAVILFVAGLGTGYILWGRGGPNKGGNVADLSANQVVLGSADVPLNEKPQDRTEWSAEKVYNTVNPSVVGIRVYNENNDGSEATGVIYTADGYVVTNDHIYAGIGAPHFRIFMYDGTEYDADYVAGDTVSDLAVLKIRKGKKLQPATFGKSGELVCGEGIVTIGRPYDASFQSTVTQGIVSAVSRRIQTTSEYASRLVQFDATINCGSSGGALANMYGQVVGITSSKLPTENGYEGMGFAIPTETVKKIAEQLISKGKVTNRAKLGISYYYVDSVTAAVQQFGSVGLYVETVSEDSDLFGKLKQGDIITHVNGTFLKNDSIILDLIEAAKPGDTIAVTVLSDGKSKDYKVKLKANNSTSSYSDVLQDSLPDSKDDRSKDKNEKSFDFPAGE